MRHAAPRLPFFSLLLVSSRGSNALCNVYIILGKSLRALVEKVPSIDDCISNLYRILEERNAFGISIQCPSFCCTSIQALPIID